jgi:hypothetical protein
MHPLSSVEVIAAARECDWDSCLERPDAGDDSGASAKARAIPRFHAAPATVVQPSVRTNALSIVAST